MTTELILALLLGAIWGEIVALFIRRTRIGVALAAHLMWLVVSVGCSGVFLIAAATLLQEGGLIYWWHMLAVMAAGCVPIAIHSLAEGLVPLLLHIIAAFGEPDVHTDTTRE